MLIKTNSLIPFDKKVICDKATENPGSGRYNDFELYGTYICRNCGLALFRSKDKFHSGCGWPSFDQEIEGHVNTKDDADGRRVEILCKRCDSHLGHVFKGENFTSLNIRHCVNSVSLDFVEDLDIIDTEEAIFAAGCFWGVEYLFKKLTGILKTEVGYSGGELNNPTYKEICNGSTGHYEAIRIIFDPMKISYEELVKYFFEIHDQSQIDGQGNDIGSQYLSVIFYYDNNQLSVAKELIEKLNKKNYSVKTKLLPVKPFWRAEEYHQDYYNINAKTPYCHFWTKKF